MSFLMERTGQVNGLDVHYPPVMTLPDRLFSWSNGHLIYSQTYSLLSRLVESHQPDLIHTHYATPNAVVGQLVCRRFGDGG